MLPITFALFSFLLPSMLIEAPIVTEIDKSEFVIVVKDHTLIFDIYEELNTEEEITAFGLVMPPAFGEVSKNNDFTFNYKPEKGLCEEIDAFSYFYETKHKRDTISINIDILCESLTIMSGFSPTTPEFNPNEFTIVGIENYPDNTLYIFNNEGNEVYYKERYMNEWDGTHNGTPLPTDYIYYYLFNDGYGESYTGYVNIK